MHPLCIYILISKYSTKILPSCDVYSTFPATKTTHENNSRYSKRLEATSSEISSYKGRTLGPYCPQFLFIAYMLFYYLIKQTPFFNFTIYMFLPIAIILALFCSIPNLHRQFYFIKTQFKYIIFLAYFQ